MVDRPDHIESLLRRTFLHVPGIGEDTERGLWSQGITSWDRLAAFVKHGGAVRARKETVLQVLRESEIALTERNGSYFAATLPPTQHWRVVPDFIDQLMFLDIESTGLSIYYDKVTVVGVSDRAGARVFIEGCNLGELPEKLAQYQVMVTFNGALFDVPFLRKNVPELRFPPIHLDLRFLMARLGHKGGLKEIEERLAIRRSADIGGMDGHDAAVLWHRFERGDIDALGRLLRYNLADTTNLSELLEYAYSELSHQTIMPIQGRLAGQAEIETWSQGMPKSTLSRDRLFWPTPNTLVAIHRSGEGLITVNVGKSPPIQWTPKKHWTPTLHLLLSELRNGTVSVVGIDLTGSSKRRSGCACIGPGGTTTSLLATDSDIVKWVEATNPTLISIDSPLSLPEGRDCTRADCECSRFGIIREAERILKKRGINVYPALLPSMASLTHRGMDLARRFRADGFDVIESYPGAAQDILGIPRKKTSIPELVKGLQEFGIPFDSSAMNKLTHDELDAITSAVVGFFYLVGWYEALPEPGPGAMIIPRLPKPSEFQE